MDKKVAGVFAAGCATGLALISVYQYVQRRFYTKETLVPIPSSTPSTSTSTTTSSLQVAQALKSLESSLIPNQKKLHEIVDKFLVEFERGLLPAQEAGVGVDVGDDDRLFMIPSHVSQRPTGKEKGHVLALDVGGTHVRVCYYTFEGHTCQIRQEKYTIPEEIKKSATADALFDYFAECIESFLQASPHQRSSSTHSTTSNEGRMKKPESYKLGLTFSFPVTQTAINKGTLDMWNKGFDVPDVVGKDVVKLLQRALDRKKLRITVKCLVNDTVATLMSHAYQDAHTWMSVILGTGTNAAYVEHLSRVPKWKQAHTKNGEMIINTEWGAFDNKRSVLPSTPYDVDMDAASPAPGKQVFEKMVSGMYLGEITRRILVDFIQRKLVLHQVSLEQSSLMVPFTFATAFLSDIISHPDHIPALFKKHFQMHVSDANDIWIIRRICELVGMRSAYLAAAGISALFLRMNRYDTCTVAIDGSLFEHYPGYQDRMREALLDTLGMVSHSIVLELAVDGSGRGAALVACTHV